MKNIFLLSLVLIGWLNVFSQSWVQKAPVPSGFGLVGPFSFSIGGKLYVGGGYGNGAARTAFYEYDPGSDTWTTKASIPGAEYTSASFVINGKGYVACGANPGLTRTVYMYDPVSNVWTQKNNFPGVSRQSCVGFSLNGKGYLFAGFIGGSSNINDMWEYDPTTDSWIQKASAPGPGRNNPSYLKISNKVYVGLGSTTNAFTLYSDFYEFDPVANTYTAVANFPVSSTCDANFTIGTDGYIGIGWNGPNSPISTFYKFNALANTWTQVNNFGGLPRAHSFCEAVGNKPYVGCGDGTSSYLHDNWTWQDSCTQSYNLGRDTTQCGGSITLSNPVAGGTSIWSTGSTSSFISVSTTGSYWVQVTKGACVYRDTINVTISSAPTTFNLGNDTIYCGAFSRQLSTSNANTHWSNGATAPFISVSMPGVYWGEISNTCGARRDSIILSENPIPVINVGNDTNLCTGSTLLLNAATSGASYAWQDGSTGSTLQVSAQGTYWVDVTVNGCRKRDSIAVGLVSPVSFNIGIDTTYCGSFVRTLTTGIAHTIWNTGDTSTSITVSTPGIYIGRIIACGDTLIDSITIISNPMPTVDLGNDTDLCVGNTTILNATTPQSVYTWQDSSIAPTFIVLREGLYWVDVTVDGCTARDSIFIAYNSPPSIVNLVGDTTICEDSSLVLNVYEPLAQYQWSTSATTPSITVKQADVYSVTVSNICGSETASANIKTIQCNCRLAIPSAFSPNGDLKNERFGIITECPLTDFRIDIYNRWGELVYNNTSLADKWDGTYKDIAQPTGSFVYYVYYTDPYTGEHKSLSGIVTLLR